jgi:hypothetical protein
VARCIDGRHRCPAARATTGIDGIVRGDRAEFITALDHCLRQPWGHLALTRTEVEIIHAPAKLIKPRRFEILAALQGQTWRRVIEGSTV